MDFYTLLCCFSPLMTLFPFILNMWKLLYHVFRCGFICFLLLKFVLILLCIKWTFVMCGIIHFYNSEKLFPIISSNIDFLRFFSITLL